jgi:hypothetical protein
MMAIGRNLKRGLLVKVVQGPATVRKEVVSGDGERKRHGELVSA